MFGVESRMNFFENLPIPPHGANVYRGVENPEDIYFWEEIDTPDGPKLTCIGWVHSKIATDVEIIGEMRDDLRWHWCLEFEDESGGMDRVTHLLKLAQQYEGLH